METINVIFKSNEDVREILANTSRKHMITPNQLVEALKMLGPIATEMHFTIKEMAEVVGVMTSHGVNCINGANQLRGMLNNLLETELTEKNTEGINKFISDLGRIENLPIKKQETIVAMVVSRGSIPVEKLINNYSI